MLAFGEEAPKWELGYAAYVVGLIISNHHFNIFVLPLGEFRSKTKINVPVRWVSPTKTNI
jgi:hypothetical protein